MTDDNIRKQILRGENPFENVEVTLSGITEGYPEDPRTDEDITMIGDHNFWKQRKPSSVAKINAEVKNVTQELSDIEIDQRRVAAIRYGKTHSISQADAAELLSQDSTLLQEWMNY